MARSEPGCLSEVVKWNMAPRRPLGGAERPTANSVCSRCGWRLQQQFSHSLGHKQMHTTGGFTVSDSGRGASVVKSSMTRRGQAAKRHCSRHMKQARAQKTLQGDGCEANGVRGDTLGPGTSAGICIPDCCPYQPPCRGDARGGRRSPARGAGPAENPVFRSPPRSRRSLSVAAVHSR